MNGSMITKITYAGVLTATIILISSHSEAGDEQKKKQASNDPAIYLSGQRDKCPITPANPLGQRIIIDCKQYGYPGVIDDKWECPKEQFLTSIELNASVLYQARMRCQTLASRKDRISPPGSMTEVNQNDCKKPNACTGRLSLGPQKNGTSSGRGLTTKSLLRGHQGICPTTASNPLGQKVGFDCSQFGQPGIFEFASECPSEESLNSEAAYLSAIHMGDIRCKTRSQKTNKKENPSSEANRSAEACVGSTSCVSGSRTSNTKMHADGLNNKGLSQQNQSDIKAKVKTRTALRESYVTNIKESTQKRQKKRDSEKNEK